MYVVTLLHLDTVITPLYSNSKLLCANLYFHALCTILFITAFPLPELFLH